MANKNLHFAKQMRKEQTKAEQILWSKLRNRQINNKKFRRQTPIENFIVDFFCHELNLIVEVDGDVHAFQQKHDKERERKLTSLGYSIVRFTNDEVISETEAVLERLFELTAK